MEITSAKYDYYHHKVSDLEQMDSKKWWKQIKLLTGQDIEHEWYHQFLGENCPGIKVARLDFLGLIAPNFEH